MKAPPTPLAMLALLGILLGCAAPQAPPATTIAPQRLTASSTPAATPTLPAPTAPSRQTPRAPTYGYTNLRADGNRLVSGRADLDATRVVDIPLAGTPLWVVGAAEGANSYWAVALSDGHVQAFRLGPQGVESADITPDHLAPGQPPLLRLEDGTLTLLNPPPDLPASPLTTPLPIPLSGLTAFLLTNGDLAFVDAQGNTTAQLAANALPDARLLGDERGRVLVLSAPSEIYTHGVLGDALEATRITLIATLPTPRVTSIIEIPPGMVVEGVAPLWLDWDGDGEREIIVTLSDAQQGAQLVIFNQEGEQIAAGDPIGQGFRWRHQIAIAPFGPSGEWELADVLTPHIGGVVEFFRREGTTLTKTASLGGFTSHVIYTRNLDLALSGDFDANGVAELLLPNQTLTALGVIGRDENGATLLMELPLDGELSSNLTAIPTEDGRILVGAGINEGVLRIWLTEEIP